MISTYMQRDIEAFARKRSSIASGVFLAEHFRHDPKTGLIEPFPYKSYKGHNAYVNLGGVLLLDLLVGAGGTVFSNANSFIGVGDGAAATASGNTDLQAALAGTMAIVSSTNATPIQMTVTGHGYANGDTVTIAGHTVNTAANGTWVIAGATANTFTLNNSVGVGVGGATGTVAKGNRMRVGMDATFPSLAGQVMTWQSTFAPGVAEWGTGILEGALFNGFVAATSTMLARIGQNLGVKAPATTLKIQYTIHVP